MNAILPLLILTGAAAPASVTERPKLQAVGTVSVEIIRAEPIFVLSPPKGARPVDRQIGRRDNIPMVDFY